jgi:hypothetical protein
MVSANHRADVSPSRRGQWRLSIAFNLEAGRLRAFGGGPGFGFFLRLFLHAITLAYSRRLPSARDSFRVVGCVSE